MIYTNTEIIMKQLTINQKIFLKDFNDKLLQIKADQKMILLLVDDMLVGLREVLEQNTLPEIYDSYVESDTPPDFK